MNRLLIAAIVALASTAWSTAEESPAIQEAMKAIGPAFMCGAPYEFGQALDGVKAALIQAGVPESLAQYSIQGLSDNVQKEHASKRDSITAKECAERYGRG